MLEEAAARVAGRLGPGTVRVALVAGSGIQLGLGGWQRGDPVPYAEIFPFAIHALLGHTPTLTPWRRGGDIALVFDGRFHLYQGYSPAQAAAIPRLSALLGAPVYLATNASGALDAEIAPGSLVVIRDHINLQGANPLVGEWGRWRKPMFPDMTNAYDPALRRAALAHATAVGFAVREGIYVGLLGPSYETPAEVRMLGAMGADVVGMSTVQEVIAAVHCGMRVAVLSLASNPAAGLAGRPLTHEEVLEAGEAAKGKLAMLLDRLVDDIVAGRA